MISATTTHTTLLVRLADREDSGAWREFCSRYGDLIRGFALRQGLQAADSDDILQDVLIKLTRSMPGFEYDATRGRFRNYLKKVVLHAIFDRFSQKRVIATVDVIGNSPELAASDPDVDDRWEVEWRRYHVHQAMRIIEVEFNDQDVCAFRAYALEGTDARQTAATLGISVDQVYQAKSQILKRLLALIRQQVEDEG